MADRPISPMPSCFAKKTKSMPVIDDPVSRIGLLRFQKIIQVSPLTFGGTANFTLAFSCVKTCSLKLQALNLFFRSNIYIIPDRFSISNAVMQQSRHFYTPALCFGFYFVFITYIHLL